MPRNFGTPPGRFCAAAASFVKKSGSPRGKFSARRFGRAAFWRLCMAMFGGRTLGENRFGEVFGRGTGEFAKELQPPLKPISERAGVRYLQEWGVVGAPLAGAVFGSV